MTTDNNANNDEHRLQELSGSDYEIADGQSDIRGWDVMDTAGVKLGEVSELIFEPATRKVRYMVVDLDNEDLNLEEREVLIPIGIAQLDEEDDHVQLPTVTVAQLQSLPAYDGADILPATEYATRNAFTAPATNILIMPDNTSMADDFYEHQHYDDQVLYRKDK